MATFTGLSNRCPSDVSLYLVFLPLSIAVILLQVLRLRAILLNKEKHFPEKVILRYSNMNTRFAPSFLFAYCIMEFLSAEMQFGDRATRRNKRPTYALQRVKQQEIGGDQISDDEDDGCAALLALQSAVPSRPPPCSPKGGKAEDERGNTSSQNGSDCLLMDKRKQKRASSSGDTGPEHGPSSSGSAEDVIYAVMPTGDGQQGQQQRRLVQGLMNESQGDELSDMEVDIVSETEKGCQVWFPPLPGDMERRRFQRHGNRYVMNQPMIIPELRASKRKRGMESVPYDGSWDMGLLMDPLMSLQPMLQSGGPFPGVADGPGNSKLQSGGGWDDDDGDGEDGSSLKDQQLHHEGTGSKRRLIWSQELHERFLAAIRKLGVKNAVPKAILNLMGVEVRAPLFDRALRSRCSNSPAFIHLPLPG